MKKATLLIVAVVVLLLAFVIGTLLHNAKKEESSVRLPEVNRAALVRMHSPSLGKIDAPVVIVEFFDPACETCRAFYPLVKEIMAANPDKIRLVLRYTPLHKGSDQVVAVLEAVRKQGKFWPALEALLGAQAAWTEHHAANVNLVWKHFDGLGLDLEKVRADMRAPEIAKLIAQDLEDAQTLGVTQTPGFFVNGRPLVDFGFKQLKQLTDDALQEATRR
jgi:protein-disulfide isomerase